MSIPSTHTPTLRFGNQLPLIRIIEQVTHPRRTGLNPIRFKAFQRTLMGPEETQALRTLASLWNEGTEGIISTTDETLSLSLPKHHPSGNVCSTIAEFARQEVSLSELCGILPTRTPAQLDPHRRLLLTGTDADEFVRASQAQSHLLL